MGLRLEPVAATIIKVRLICFAEGHQMLELSDRAGWPVVRITNNAAGSIGAAGQQVLLPGANSKTGRELEPRGNVLLRIHFVT